MSRQTMSRNNTPTAYCKVCQDAGKPESVYRSHYTRETKDPNSRVTCPTLLALECRFCFKKGHTVKYCKTLKEKDQQKPKPKPQATTTPQKQAPQSNNSFSCLESDSDEEEQQIIVPNKSVANKSVANPATNSYAAALAKPIPAPAPTVAFIPKFAPEVATLKAPIRRPMTCWADDSDTEDEEDLIRPAKPIAVYNEDW